MNSKDKAHFGRFFFDYFAHDWTWLLFFCIVLTGFACICVLFMSVLPPEYNRYSIRSRYELHPQSDCDSVINSNIGFRTPPHTYITLPHSWSSTLLRSGTVQVLCCKWISNLTKKCCVNCSNPTKVFRELSIFSMLVLIRLFSQLFWIVNQNEL